MADEGDSTELEPAKSDPVHTARRWRAELDAAQKAQKKWAERAAKIEKLYADERSEAANRQRRFNILWSNVETQRPAVYMQTPKARAVRRYKDRDPVARFASLLIERCVQTSCELYDFDDQMDQAVRDRLVVGRGVVWVFYEPDIQEGADGQEFVAYEDVRAEYVPWQDYLHSVARTWDEVRWVARRFYKSKRELRKWLKEIGSRVKAEDVQLDFSAEGEKADDGLKDERNKAQIWEVWDKDSGQMLYVAPGSGDNAILGVREPPVRYRGFFPCPRPFLATTTAKSLIPTPDYVQYQDQAEELNRITARIGVLQKALKAAGLYNAANGEIADLLEVEENRMIPVQNWAVFTEGGRAGGQIDWFPVDVIAKVLESLYVMRDQAKQTLYEVSGIGDILRGSTDPDETATAQGIKAKWGSLRVRKSQKRSQGFAGEVFSLKAEVICEQFSFQTILRMAAVDDELLAKYVPKPPPPPMPPPPPQPQPGMGMNGQPGPQAGPPGAPPGQPQQPDPAMMQAMQRQAEMQARQQFLAEVEQLLKNDAMRNFRVTVQPDSMLEPDVQEEKQTAVEFTTALASFMKEVMIPAVSSGTPAAVKMAGQLLLFTMRRFDRTAELEDVVEQFIEEASKPKPPPPNPEAEKVKAEAARDKAKLAMEAKQADMEQQREERRLGLEQQATQAEIAGNVAKTQADIALQREKADAQITIQAQKAAADRAMREGAPPE